MTFNHKWKKALETRNRAWWNMIKKKKTIKAGDEFKKVKIECVKLGIEVNYEKNVVNKCKAEPTYLCKFKNIKMRRTYSTVYQDIESLRSDT